jgi:hypothetical protein
MSDELPVDPLAEGLVYAENLPLAWSVSPLPEGEAQAHLNEHNDATLRVMLLLDEVFPVSVDDYANQLSELARVDLKINLVLELVGRIIRSQSEMPPCRAVRIGGRGIEWLQTEAGAAVPEVGAAVQGEIYLQPKYPQSVMLTGVVTAVDALPEGQRVRMAFAGISEPVIDRLETLIFRHHRRSIAHRRTP